MKTPRAPTEAQLVSQAVKGDRRAFSGLILLHQSAVRQQLRRLTKGNVALADDLAQETFIQAWTHLHNFNGAARLTSWLYRIAYNQFLMHVRSEPAMPALERKEGGIDHARQHDLAFDLNWAIAQLPEPQRVALIHCYQLDLSHEEAAHILDMPLGTLKSHLLRGKAQLRLLLGAWSEELAR